MSNTAWAAAVLASLVLGMSLLLAQRSVATQQLLEAQATIDWLKTRVDERNALLEQCWGGVIE